MEIYKGTDGRSYVVVGKMSQDDAIKEANKHFKTKKDDLKVCDGFIQGDDLFFEKGHGGKKVLVVYHERKVS